MIDAPFSRMIRVLTMSRKMWGLEFFFALIKQSAKSGGMLHWESSAITQEDRVQADRKVLGERTRMKFVQKVKDEKRASDNSVSSQRPLNFAAAENVDPQIETRQHMFVCFSLSVVDHLG